MIWPLFHSIECSGLILLIGGALQVAQCALVPGGLISFTNNPSRAKLAMQSDPFSALCNTTVLNARQHFQPHRGTLTACLC